MLTVGVKKVIVDVVPVTDEESENHNHLKFKYESIRVRKIHLIIS